MRTTPARHHRPLALSGPARDAAAHGRRPEHGLGLVELLVVLAIAATLLASALQAMRGIGQRHALESVAALLETDLRLARAMALAQDAPLRFEVQVPAAQSSCYLIYSGPAGSCSCRSDGTASCQAGGRTWRAAAQPAEDGVRILHSGRPLLFDPGKGTVTPTATLVVTDRDGLAIHQIVNLMGRVRSCSPQGVGGLRACS